jgi:hypothetical protein
MDTKTPKRFLDAIPELLRIPELSDKVERHFGGDVAKTVSSGALVDLHDNVREAYSELADSHLVISPGAQGAVIMEGLGGYYVVTCRDQRDSRVFSSLDDALKLDECQIRTTGAQMTSDFLSEQDLLLIAESLIDKDAVSHITLNGVTYAMDGRRLVPI